MLASPPTTPAIAFALLVCGCGNDRIFATDPSSTSATHDGSSTSSPATDGATSSADDGSASGPVDDSSTGPDPGSAFLDAYDFAAWGWCDQFTQDCPPGEKCMPYMRTWGWDGTRCVPIHSDPKQAGEPCTVQSSLTSGLDDCDIGLMCWHIGPDLTGVCENMCVGTFANPVCADPSEVCANGSDALALCLSPCHPFADCASEMEACYPYWEHWLCQPDASDDGGAVGEPCEFINGCDAGAVCLPSALFSACAGALGCCSAVCDLADANADEICLSLDPAQACVPWYAPEHAAPGFDDVGVCMIPP